MKVSIIVPLFNEQANIKKLYESIINNGYENLELIFIDDGSTDNSLKILRDIEKCDNRVKILTQNNSGVSVARNKGILASSGEYLMFCDCDDLFIDGSIKAMVDAILQTDSPIVQGAFNDNEGIIYDSSIQVVNSDFLLKSVISCGFIGHPDIPQQFVNSSRGVYGKMYKSSIIRNQKFLNNLKIGEDLLFLLNVYLSANSITLLNKKVYSITQNPNSSTRKFNPGLVDSCFVFIHEIDNIIKRYQLEGVEEELLYIKYSTCRISVNSKFYHPLAIGSFHNRYCEYKDFFSNKIIIDIYTGVYNETKNKKLNLSNKELLEIYLINKHKFWICFILFNKLRKIKRYLIKFYERKN